MLNAVQIQIEYSPLYAFKNFILFSEERYWLIYFDSHEENK